MARTYRRKNYEATRNSSWDVKGFKTARHYTTYDGYSWEECNYRQMDARERYHEWRWMHGESPSAQTRSPGWTYRQWRMDQNRMINKQEILKWIKAAGEYEPMFEADPRNCWWDWS